MNLVFTPKGKAEWRAEQRVGVTPRYFYSPARRPKGRPSPEAGSGVRDSRGTTYQVQTSGALVRLTPKTSKR